MGHEVSECKSVRFLESEGVILGAHGISLQWIVKYPNADPANKKSTTELAHIHTCVVYVLQNDLLGGMKSVRVMQATSQTTVDEQER